MLVWLDSVFLSSAVGSLFFEEQILFIISFFIWLCTAVDSVNTECVTSLYGQQELALALSRQPRRQYLAVMVSAYVFSGKGQE